jgi:hypothetical protein
LPLLLELQTPELLCLLLVGLLDLESLLKFLENFRVLAQFIGGFTLSVNKRPLHVLARGLFSEVIIIYRSEIIGRCVLLGVHSNKYINEKKPHFLLIEGISALIIKSNPPQ